jgi:membrane protein
MAKRGAAKKSDRPDWDEVAAAAAYAVTRVLERGIHEPAPPGTPKAVPRSGWPFWKHVGLRIAARVSEDRLLAVAAGVVFYALLALFPGITALVSSYALFANAATIGDHLASLASFVPESAYGIVHEQVLRIANGGATGRLSFAFVVGLGLAIWSANAGMKAMMDALNVAYQVKEHRSFIVLNAVSLAFTVGALAAMLVAIAAIVMLPVFVSYLPFEGTANILKWLRWPALAVLLLLGLATLYRFGPDHKDARWQWISPGAAFAAVSWLAGSALLSWYLGSFADYNKTYGSLGAAIGLMMWMWMSAIVVMMGAEINSVLDGIAADHEDLAQKAGVT